MGERETPAVMLDFRKVWCEEHARPLKPTYPKYAAQATIGLMNAFMASDELDSRMPRNEDGLKIVGALDSIVADCSPLCCLLGESIVEKVIDAALNGVVFNPEGTEMSLDRAELWTEDRLGLPKKVRDVPLNETGEHWGIEDRTGQMDAAEFWERVTKVTGTFPVLLESSGNAWSRKWSLEYEPYPKEPVKVEGNSMRDLVEKLEALA